MAKKAKIEDTDNLVAAINGLTSDEPVQDAPADDPAPDVMSDEPEVDRKVESEDEEAGKPVDPAMIAAEDDTVLQAHLLRQKAGVEEWMKPEDERVKRRQAIIDENEKIRFENDKARREAEEAKRAREEREGAQAKIGELMTQLGSLNQQAKAIQAEIDRLSALAKE